MACKSTLSVSFIPYRTSSHVMLLHVTLPDQGDDSSNVLAELQQFLAAILNSQCKCGVTPSHISEGEFSCRRGSGDSINYRARIKGTSSRSASDLVALIQSWVQGGQASVHVESARFSLDPSCSAALDNIHALDCGSQPLTPTEPPSQSVSRPPQQETPYTQSLVDNSESMSSAQAGGFVLGGIVAGVLLVLMIVFIVVLVMLKRNNT